MQLELEQHEQQKRIWPKVGRHILAQFDDTSIVVYQAYRPETGQFAARNGYFGDGFSLNRMSWIKPNFLWMIYRCGWATKANQETVLAVRIRRVAFDTILAQAVHSSYVPEVYASEAEWKRAVELSDVRLQWDPDHEPNGHPLERRAIQLGLRGEVLRRYAREWIVAIEDITHFVHEQRDQLDRDASQLLMPRERVYPVADPNVVTRLGLYHWTEATTSTVKAEQL